MKILPVGAEFYADGRTERHDEATSRLSQYVSAAKNEVISRNVYVNSL
jgi:hypothetical protein